MAALPVLRDFDIERFFATDVKQFIDVLSDLEKQIDSDSPPQPGPILDHLTAAIHQSREACQLAEAAIADDTQLLRESQNRFRTLIAPYFDQSWFMQRAKAKPRGYPGDFQMLTAIYDGQTKSNGIGGYLDLYFLNSDLANAVCERLTEIKKFILEEVEQHSGQFAVLNVASGPGREYSDGFAGKPAIQLTCVDSDEGALQYLQDHIDPQAADVIELQCVKYNALKMTNAKTNIAKFGVSQLIYSVGLCDYIPDRYLIKILDGWRQSVSQDGIVYVAFKDCLKYCAAEYQWHVDWHFYQRTEEDCVKLFAKAGYATEHLELTRDSTGIIINIVARKQALGENRVSTQESDGTRYTSSRVTPLDSDS